MIPAPFDYAKPATLHEALTLLSEPGVETKVLAGGHSLLPMMRLRLARPEILIDISELDELKGCKLQGESVVVGAATPYVDILRNPILAEHCGVLPHVVRTIGDRQVRTRGTIGGGLAHADPAGDLPALARALDATFTISSPTGERRVSAQDFFQGYMTTSLGRDEVLAAIEFPTLGPKVRWRYEKYNRTAQGWAIVGSLCVVETSAGQSTNARIALTHMGPTPVRATHAEDLLRQGASLDAVAHACDQEAEPMEDGHADGNFRRHLAHVLTRRALQACLEPKVPSK